MQKTAIGYWFQPKKVKILLGCALFVLAVGCHKETLPTEQQLGNLLLQKVDFGDLPGWSKEDFAQIISTFGKNCQTINKNKSTYIYSSAIKIKTADMQKICQRFLNKGIDSGAEMKTFIESEFVPYAITDNGNPEGKFTSYYEATIRASFEKSTKYKYPVYGKPQDLIEINLRDFGADLPNTRLVGRVEGRRFVPYYNRRQIEQNGIDAPVLLWGDDLVDIHFMQIQGSAIAQMDDGSELRIGFADSNGHKFKGIGGILLEKKLIEPKDASMPKIREWLRKNPQKAENLMRENDRYIFQRISDADGPVGALGISLTAGRSLAVDNQYLPLGAVLWLDTVSPDKEKIQKIVFAQDIGSAIKGIVRGDYFWGHGEEALMQAGRMNSAGRYYILAPKYSALKAE